MSPIFNNFSTSPATTDSSLAAALAQAAGAQVPFDVASLTDAGRGGSLTGRRRLTTAESARATSLNSATQITTKAIDAAATISTGGAPGTRTTSPTANPAGKRIGFRYRDGRGRPGQAQANRDGFRRWDWLTAQGAEPIVLHFEPGDGLSEDHPLSIYFNFDEAEIVDVPPAGNLGAMQFNSLNIFVREALMHATQVMVTGYASPEGDENHNNTLAQNRANAVTST